MASCSTWAAAAQAYEYISLVALKCDGDLKILTLRNLPHHHSKCCKAIFSSSFLLSYHSFHRSFLGLAHHTHLLDLKLHLHTPRCEPRIRSRYPTMSTLRTCLSMQHGSGVSWTRLSRVDTLRNSLVTVKWRRIGNKPCSARHRVYGAETSRNGTKPEGYPCPHVLNYGAGTMTYQGYDSV